MATAMTPAKKKTKKPATPSKLVESALTDARYISGRAKARFAAIKKFDASRKQKLLPEADLKSYVALIRQLSTARGLQSVKLVTSKTETAAEREARSAVFAVTSDIRETVRLAYPGDSTLHAAFGVGHRAKTSADARDLSSLLQNSYADPKLGPKAKAAGITPSHIAQAIDLRRTLITVAGDRTANSGAKKGDTAQTKTLARRLEKTTTRVIQIAKLALKDNPKLVAEFTRPSHRKPKKKKAPPTGAAT